MRLLLDEHYDRRIAEQLRRRGHDVVAATERSDLLGLPDDELLARAHVDRRALLTEDVRDFTRLVRDAAASGVDHHGLVFAHPRALPRGSDTIGRFVSALDELLRLHPGEDALLNDYRWLTPP